MADDEAAQGPPDSERPSAKLRRDADLLGASNSACRKWLTKRIDAIVRGFEEQADRSDKLDSWWNIYNCNLDDAQYYNGNAQVYVPIIHDAINARATRFTNQLFPASGRYLDCTPSDGHEPYELLALLNHYIDEAHLATDVVRPLFIAGDVEGQHNIYVDWAELRRQVVSRQTREPEMGGATAADDGEIVDIKEEDILEGRPVFDVPHDADVLILPATSDSVNGAFAAGGSVTIVRRWSKSKFEAMAAAGEIKAPKESDLDKKIVTASMAGLNDMAKKLARTVGIRASGPHWLGFETWLMVPLSEKGVFSEDKGIKRLCRLWWDITKEPVGLKRNPFWNDKCPLLSRPAEKMRGVVKGKSQVEALAPVQYEANDAANERADADHYGAMPIIARRPGEGSGTPLILNLAAVWDVAPGDVQFMQFPDLSERGRARVQDAMGIIFQSLGVNPSMLPNSTGRPGARRNQAEVALEQQVDLLTVAEGVRVVSEMLSEVASWIVDLDHQFRDRELTVKKWGRLGIMAEMETIPPLQNGARYRVTWAGAEQARLNVAMQQQGTAFINVLNGAAQQVQAEGYRVRIGPLIERSAMNIFGPVTGGMVLEDLRHQMSIPAEQENEMMLNGFMVPTSPFDNDQGHLPEHQQAMQQSGDPYGTLRPHIQEHLLAMAGKQKAAMAQQMGPQMGPGGPGAPQPGAVPQGPRLIKGPPGQIPPEQMPRAGAVMMPRKM